MNAELSRINQLACESVTDRSKRNVCAILVRDYASRHGLSESDKTPAELSDSDKKASAARRDMLASCWSFVTNPTNETFTLFMRDMFADDKAILSQSDKMPAKLLNPAADAPDVSHVFHGFIAPDGLTWQTKPAMSINPMLYAMLDQASRKPRKRVKMTVVRV